MAAKRSRYVTRLIGMGLVSLASLTVCAHAFADDGRLIDGSSQCTRHFARLEREYGIPKHLMMAVGGTESGRWSNEVGMAVPWPWTINAEGKGQYFASMQEAIATVRHLQARGVRSIDVGCMQVNLKHHPHAFANLAQAFDPAYNTTYAAKFLKQNYLDTRSWNEAIAAYHSKGTQRGRDYFGLVKRNWQRVLAAVRGERLDDLPYVAHGGGGAQLASLEVGGVQGSLRGGSRSADRALSGYRAPSMKVITVSDGQESAARDSEVLVIRPAAAKQAVEKKVADAVLVASNEMRQERDDSFVMGVGIRRPSVPSLVAASGEDRVSSRKHGPNFIFN